MKKGPLQREEEKEKTCGVVKGGEDFLSGTTSLVLEPLIENRENKKLSGADDDDVVPKNKKTLDTSFTTDVLSLLAKQSCLLGFKGEERKKTFPWYKNPRQPCPRPLTFSLRARCAHLGHFEETRPAMQKGERERAGFLGTLTTKIANLAYSPYFLVPDKSGQKTT